VLVVNGSVRDRFVVRMGRPLVVGRSPDDPDGIRIGEYLSGDAAAMVSRNHVRLELHEDALYAIDLSTNGTVVRNRSNGYPTGDEFHLTGAPPYPLKPWDGVELHDGVYLARADKHQSRSYGGPGSVMGDAPTITMRPQY
jgi:pSer/pThr/pTyr-binding forkhead associated (FHA) protein